MKKSQDSEPLSSMTIGPLQYLLESTKDMRCVIKDREHRYLFVSPSWFESFRQFSREDVLGKTASELFPKWRAERYLREERRVMEEALVYDYLEYSINSDGEVEQWRTVKAPWIENGEIVGYSNLGTRFDASPEEHRQDQIPDIVKAIARHACDELSIDEIADKNNISRRTLERKFKEAMRQTPLQFRTHCKIIHAKRLLGKGEELSDVANRCGFSDQSHFTKVFAHHEGVTPKKYQQSVL